MAASPETGQAPSLQGRGCARRLTSAAKADCVDGANGGLKPCPFKTESKRVFRGLQRLANGTGRCGASLRLDGRGRPSLHRSSFDKKRALGFPMAPSVGIIIYQSPLKIHRLFWCYWVGGGGMAASPETGQAPSLQ